MASGKFYGIGVGPGDPRLITLMAVELLEKMDVIFEAASLKNENSISGSIADIYSSKSTERVRLDFSMSEEQVERSRLWNTNADIVAGYIESGKNCAFVTIGDPLIYSTYIYIMRRLREILPDVSIETIPGITSFQAAAAKANMPIVEDKETLGLIPAWTPESSDHPLWDASDSLVLLKTYKYRNELLDVAVEKGFTDGIYAARLGLDGEKIVYNLSDVRELPTEYLSLMILKKRNSGAK